MKSVFRAALALLVWANLLLSSLALCEGSELPQSATQTKEVGGAAGDQTAPPPEGHTTLIGCLSGPNAEGEYMLRSMSHRTGVDVVGSDDLKKSVGAKVKLTGSWKSGNTPAVKGKESRRFQASEVEVMSENCEAPTEKTPVSKEKQAKQQQKQNSPMPPGDTPNPK